MLHFDNPAHLIALRNAGLLAENQDRISVGDLVDHIFSRKAFDTAIDIFCQEIITYYSLIDSIGMTLGRAKRSVDAIHGQQDCQEARKATHEVSNTIFKADEQTNEIKVCIQSIDNRLKSEEGMVSSAAFFTQTTDDNLEKIDETAGKIYKLVSENGDNIRRERDRLAAKITELCG